MGPLIPLFWTSGDVCPGFQSQGGFSCLCASLPAHNRFLRFTSGATPADCICDATETGGTLPVTMTNETTPPPGRWQAALV